MQNPWPIANGRPTHVKSAAPDTAKRPATDLTSLAVDNDGDPLMVAVTRQTNCSSADPVDAYPVVGTDGVWAVYPSKDKKGRWIGLHIPTGLSCYVNFASREEAEDVLSWTWMNSSDKEGIHSSDVATVLAAFGARVRKRFYEGGPLKHPRRKQPGKLNRHDAIMSAGEQLYTKKARELHSKHAECLAQTHVVREMLADQARALTIRETTVERMEARANQEVASLHAKQAELANERRRLEASITERQDEQDRYRTELARQAMDLDRLRTAMYSALAAIDVGAVLMDGEQSAGRYLRKIRIKGVYNPALDQE